MRPRGLGRAGCSAAFLTEHTRRNAAEEADAKADTKRQEIVVESCFVPLLRWVVSRWQGTQLALALDATTLGDRFVVLAISVVYRGCAIPVAWTILAAGEKHAWRREWLRMLRLLRPAVPSMGRRTVPDDGCPG